MLRLCLRFEFSLKGKHWRDAWTLNAAGKEQAGQELLHCGNPRAHEAYVGIHHPRKPENFTKSWKMVIFDYRSIVKTGKTQTIDS